MKVDALSAFFAIEVTAGDQSTIVCIATSRALPAAPAVIEESSASTAPAECEMPPGDSIKLTLPPASLLNPIVNAALLLRNWEFELDEEKLLDPTETVKEYNLTQGLPHFNVYLKKLRKKV